MALSSEIYWHNRLQDRFRPALHLERELGLAYDKAYEQIYAAYYELISPYRIGDTYDFKLLASHLNMGGMFEKTYNKFTSLLTLIDKTVHNMRVAETDKVGLLMMDTFKENFYRVLYKVEKDVGHQLAFTLLSKERLEQVLHTNWSRDGGEFSSRIWINKRHLNKQLRELITNSIASGKSPIQTSILLQEATGNSFYNCKRIIRTETMAIITDSDAAAFQEAGIDEYEVLSTFDRRTSIVCQKQDGKKYPVSEMKISTNAPPFHPNCRTTIIPVMKEPSQMRTAKDSSGRPIKVPANMTYEQYQAKHLIN
jgi:SPP1 gp7 family putative phage head morphogenesis protein